MVLGYPTLILVLVSGYWGWALLRQSSYEKATSATVYAVLFAALVASLFGLTHFSFSQVMSGAIGRFIATLLTTALGSFGAWAVLLALLVATLVLCIDLDIQKTADRMLYLFRDKAKEAQLRFKEWYKIREMRRKAAQDADEQEEDDSAIPQPECAQEAEANVKKTATQQTSVQLPESVPARAAAQPSPYPASNTAQTFHSVMPDVRTQKMVAEVKESVCMVKSETKTKPETVEQKEMTMTAPLEPEKTAEATTQSIGAQDKTDEIEPQNADDANPFNTIELERKLAQAEAQEFKALAIKTTTNWAKAFSQEPDTDIDDILQEFLSKKVGKADEENLSKASEKESVSFETEPEITIISPVKDAEADLDDRPLEIETKEKFTYQFPSIDLLTEPEPEQDTVSVEELEENKHKLLEKLRIYKIEITRIEATVGPRVTLFELELAPDVKVSRIVALQDDLAMAMAARGIRIIAPIPGKNAVGVEIPNAKPRMVRIKSLLNSEKFKRSKFKLPIAFGRTIANEIFIDDLTKMPHLLVAGATGSGKSVGINTILTSLLYFCSPEQVKFLLIDLSA